jgi:HPr kinase/phosphorylase
MQSNEKGATTQIHASCVARGDAGVLLLGPSGCGKSDLVLRLLECGFVLVADDRVNIEGGVASAPAELAGLLEVRGLGILRLPHVNATKLALAVELAGVAERLPQPRRHATLGLPLVSIAPAAASACARVAAALDCALGRKTQIAGAFQS